MLNYKHVCLESFGYVVPPNAVSSLEIEQELAEVYERFGAHQGRLEMMSGIRERRFWDEGTMPSDGSAEAGRKALEASRVDPGEIECLINTSVSRDCLEPATASIVHEKLHLPSKSVMYDISNACLGFLNGMVSLANMIELGQVRRGLIVAGESSRNLVRTTINQLRSATKLTRAEFKNAFASLTIGSGAAALVMTHDSVTRTGHRLMGGVVRSATEFNNLCRGSADTGFGSEAEMSMNTDSESLLNGGCLLASKTWNTFKKVLAWADHQIDRTYCHQVGATHRDRFYESIGLKPERDFSTFEFLGNVGSVSLPLTMAMGIEQSPPQPGEKIAMLGIGSGLSCVMLGTKW
ncbi:MAG: 3-oxoacyl-ACP synthase III [Planctomycetota bacterium]|jgi:3-oxoacyl-[acyl-carrier-protein] synthase-3